MLRRSIETREATRGVLTDRFRHVVSTSATGRKQTKALSGVCPQRDGPRRSGLGFPNAKLVCHEMLERGDGNGRLWFASKCVPTSRDYDDPCAILVVRHSRNSERQCRSRQQGSLRLDDSIVNRLKPILAVVRHPRLRALPIDITLRLAYAEHGIAGHRSAG